MMSSVIADTAEKPIKRELPVPTRLVLSAVRQAAASTSRMDSYIVWMLANHSACREWL